MPGFFIGTSPLKEAYVGTTPVKEIYVGTTKVRPTEFTRTYTVPATGGSAVYSPNMYIAGSKIKKIVVEGSISSSSTWTDCNFAVLRNSTTGTTYGTDFYIRAGSNVSYYGNCGSMNVYNGSSWGGGWAFPSSWYNGYGSLNLKAEITETAYTVRVGSNSHTWTFSTAEANYIKSLFQSNCYMRSNSNSISVGQATITVTYG